MALERTPFYPHRRNKDGSFTSICLTCFATVAARTTEVELIEEEKQHVCIVSPLTKRGNLVQMGSK